jgi:hypothetical protein
MFGGSIGSALGFGGGSSTQKSQPWGPQGEELKWAYKYGRPLAQDYWRGDFYQPTDYWQRTGAQALYDMSTGMAPMYSDQYYGMGNAIFNKMPTAIGSYMDFAKGGNDVAGPYSGDIPYEQLSGVRDAIMRDDYRNVYERGGQMESIGQQAAASDNVGSSGRLFAEMLADRAYQDRDTDVMAGLVSDYEQQRMMNDQFNAQQRMQGTDSLYNAIQGGTDLMDQAYNYAGMGVQGIIGAGDYRYGLNQRQLENDIQRQYAWQDPFYQYMAMVQGGDWGGKTSGSYDNWSFDLSSAFNMGFG